MKLLSIRETGEWLQSRQIGFVVADHPGADHQVVLPAGATVREFLIPSRAREQLVLAHQLGRWFSCSQALLVVTVVTGFSEAEMDLFLDLRRFFGHDSGQEGVPGGGTPGYLFDDSDDENRRTLTEYLYLLMALNFEGYFVEREGRSVICCGDDIMGIHTRDRQKVVELDRILDEIGPQSITKIG